MSRSRCWWSRGRPAANRIRREVLAEIEVRPAHVRVLPPGSLPKTPSGKLKRGAARSLLD